MKPFVMVTGDFVETGGMDAANHALAGCLSASGNEVHVVAHRVEARLARATGVHVHLVPRPAGSNYLGAPLLDRAARRAISGLGSRHVVSIINGGNCGVGWMTWLHYVHAAHSPLASSGVQTMLAAWKHRQFLSQERAAVRRAGLVVANSDLTRHHAIDRLGANPERVHTVYYGTDERFRPPSGVERERARQALGVATGGPVAAFVGALGDRRKGFDRVLSAWAMLCAGGDWRGTLLVVGAGAERATWERSVERLGLSSRVHFHGFAPDVREVLWASDVMLAPSRYEAYGLAVHEAVCCGMSVVATDDAGVTERFDPVLRELLVTNRDDDGAGIVASVRRWYREPARYGDAVATTGARLRAWSWADMSARILDLVEMHSARTMA